MYANLGYAEIKYVTIDQQNNTNLFFLGKQCYHEHYVIVIKCRTNTTNVQYIHI